LVDFVTAESLLAGRFAGEWAVGIRRPGDNIQLVPGSNVRYCLPHTLSSDRQHTIYMRCKKPMSPCHLQVGELLEKKLRFVVPAEMITFKLKPDLLSKFQGDSLRIDIIAADKNAAAILAYQHTNSADIIPSDSKLKAEKFFKA
jgi:hypothetical protein